MTPPTPVIMPVLAHPDLTDRAVRSVLGQTVPIRLLIINQGVDDPFRAQLEGWAEADDQVLLWSHQPPLPSLAATWNRALDFAWATGAETALVVNNDVELHPRTVQLLDSVIGHTDALFVSAVGVLPDQFDPAAEVDDGWLTPPDAEGWAHPVSPGGPDFSCFLIRRACHARFRFDEAFTPAFCEDLDYHRRLLLADEGARIFSVNLPYLHHGSATLRSLDPAARQALDQRISQGSRAYYARKWGGPVNAETFFSPFDEGVTYSTAGMPTPPTTPALQAWVQQGGPRE